MVSPSPSLNSPKAVEASASQTILPSDSALNIVGKLNTLQNDRQKDAIYNELHDVKEHIKSVRDFVWTLNVLIYHMNYLKEFGKNVNNP